MEPQCWAGSISVPGCHAEQLQASIRQLTTQRDALLAAAKAALDYTEDSYRSNDDLIRVADKLRAAIGGER